MATPFHLPKIRRALLAGLVVAHTALANPAPERDVSWTVRAWDVHGTLALPKTDASAGIVFLAGSGPTDRNWETKASPGKSGTARQLATILTQSGIASIRYDKLGSGKTGLPDVFSKEAFEYTPKDYLNETLGAVDILENALKPGTPIFLAGHSEGGLWALEAYRQQPDRFDGIILMATAGRSQCTVIQEQILRAMQDYGIDDTIIQSEMLLFKNALHNVAVGTAITDSQRPSLPLLQQLIAGYSTPQTAEIGRWICGTDPVTILPLEGKRLLILQGGNDLQVHPERDGQRLHEAAPTATYVLAPNADHVLKQLDLKGAPLQRAHMLLYNQEGRSLDPILTDAILTWVRAHIDD